MAGAMKDDIVKSAVKNRKKKKPKKPSKAALKALHDRTAKSVDRLVRDR